LYGASGKRLGLAPLAGADLLDGEAIPIRRALAAEPLDRDLKRYDPLLDGQNAKRVHQHLVAVRFGLFEADQQAPVPRGLGFPVALVGKRGL
jgi:hypothetical protein